jgi:hypothetical protein
MQLDQAFLESTSVHILQQSIEINSHSVAYVFHPNIQSEHEVFPWLQTFITRKLSGKHIYIFFQNVTQLKKFFLQLT